MNIGKIVIGTAQMGFNYSITKNKLFTSKKKIKEIFTYAKKNKIKFLDTAMNYGDAQKKIGYFDKKKEFKVITKLSKIGNIPLTKLENVVKKKIFKTLKDLKRNSIDILLIHNFEDVHLNKGKLLDVLHNFKKKRIIKIIGVSVYSPKEASYCIKQKEVNFLQIPFNILDQRWKNKDFLINLKKRKDVIIQVRSIFLKGLILNNYELWPSSIKKSKQIVEKIEKLVIQLKRKNKIDLCLSYINSFKWINFITVGVDDVVQLKEIVKFRYAKKMFLSEKKTIYNHFKQLNDRVLIPTRWSN